MSDQIPKFTIADMVEAGVHFGHSTSRWNPKMGPYIYGVQNGTHIINLEKTIICLKEALEFIYEKAKNNGRVLFIGTKMQASSIVKSAAMKCSQYYVNHRWLGGMLTNFNTVSSSISRLVEYEKFLAQESEAYTKKERILVEKKRVKLELALGGIRNLGGLPDAIFIIDSNKEHVAVAEAKRLRIPIIAVVDTNSDPTGIDYIIPGNDDATRAIEFYCNIVADTILSGIASDLQASGVDIGSMADVGSTEKNEGQI